MGAATRVMGHTPIAGGLFEQEAAERMIREGYHELLAQEPRSVLAIGL